MYVIREKTNSERGSFNVGYYKPNGEFYTEKSFKYVSRVYDYNPDAYCREKENARFEAREFCSRMNGGCC